MLRSVARSWPTRGWSRRRREERSFALARYDSLGTLDVTFNGDGKVRTNFTGGVDTADAFASPGRWEHRGHGGGGVPRRVDRRFRLGVRRPAGCRRDVGRRRQGRRLITRDDDSASGVAIQANGNIGAVGDREIYRRRSRGSPSRDAGGTVPSTRGSAATAGRRPGSARGSTRARIGDPTRRADRARRDPRSGRSTGRRSVRSGQVSWARWAPRPPGQLSVLDRFRGEESNLHTRLQRPVSCR